MLQANISAPTIDISRSQVAAGQAISNLEHLFTKQPVERFEPGETIFFEGDPAKHVFEVTEGIVRVFKILADGRRVITDFLFAGSIVGVSQQHVCLYGAEVVTHAKVRRITRKSLKEAADLSPELRPQLFTKICDEMAAAQEQMVLLSCKTAEERVCSFLFQMLKRSGNRYAPSVIELQMTRLDIADYLGLTIETVSRNLTKLAGKGIISQVERFTLHIDKPHALEEMAGLWNDAEEIDCGGAKAAAAGYRH